MAQNVVIIITQTPPTTTNVRTYHIYLPETTSASFGPQVTANKMKSIVNGRSWLDTVDVCDEMRWQWIEID